MQRTIELARTATARTSTGVSDTVQPEPTEDLRVEHFATAKLPTEHGEFKIVAFKNNRDGKDHIAIVKGDIEGEERVACRIHSECLTGDVFGSLVTAGIMGEMFSIFSYFTNDTFGTFVLFVLIVIFLRFRPQGIFAPSMARR